MKRVLTVLALAAVSLALMFGSAVAHHQHQLDTPGTRVVLPCEPPRVALSTHPMHRNLHKGSGAPSDTTTIVTGGDPVAASPTGESCPVS